LLKTVNDCKYIVTLEENMRAGGFGSAVLEELQAAGILDRVKTLSLGIPDCFVPHGNKEALLKSLRLDADSLAERIAAFCRA
jgi:1-deoxy-D-xylulose-5-phosphate synthase